MATRRTQGGVTLPHRVWFMTENGWTSRAWYKGEPQAYRDAVWPECPIENLTMLDVGGVDPTAPSVALEREGRRGRKAA